MSCVPNVVSVSGLSLVYRMLSVSLDCLVFIFFIASSVFSNVYLLVCSVSCVPNVVSVSGLSFLYCIFGTFSLTFYLLVCSVSCVPNVVSVSGLSFLYCIFGIL